MHEIAHDGIHYFTHADKGIFQLLRDLTLKGGVVAREFIAGKRKKYFPPLNFFLIVAALNLFAINADEHSDRPDMARQQATDLAHIANPEQRAVYVKMLERQTEAVNFIRHNSNKTLILMLPVVSLIFFLFYRKSGYNYTEHLFAGMYMYGYCTLVFVVIALLNLLFKIDINLIYSFALLLQLLYFAWFYYRFMGNTRGGRAFAASFTSLFVLFLISGIGVMIYMITG